MVSIALAVLFASVLSSISCSKEGESRVLVNSNGLEIGIAEKVALTIVYDNNPYDERLETAWGFGCYVNVDGVRILFDTGGDPSILLENMAKLNIDVREIEIIVLSHIHGDHVGGLFGVLELNSRGEGLLANQFSRRF